MEKSLNNYLPGVSIDASKLFFFYSFLSFDLIWKYSLFIFYWSFNIHKNINNQIVDKKRKKKKKIVRIMVLKLDTYSNCLLIQNTFNGLIED